MKKLLLMLLALVLTIGMRAQHADIKAPDLIPADRSQAIISTQGLSSTSAFLVVDILTGQLSDNQLAEKYGMVSVANEWYVTAFVALNDGTRQSQLKAMGIIVSSANGNELSVLIPLARFVALTQSGLCSWVDVGVKSKACNNLSRTASHVDQVYNGIGLSQGYNGQGVVVGIIDIGFEYNHPTFYDSTGTQYRVKRVWNQTASTGSAPVGFGYGAEYTTTSAILSAAYSHSDESHGTHVAGIAAGSGGVGARAMRGMAPMADIVLVATNMMSTGIYDGINYIYNYAASVNKPCVINMSIGSHVGPHDGTSTFDRQCDNFTSLHSTGLLLVGSAGNEGSKNLHISKSFTATDTLLYTFLDFGGSSAGTTIVDLWGSPNTTFGVEIGVVNGNGQFEDNTNLYFSSSNDSYNFTLTDADNESAVGMVYCSGTNTYNNRPNITISIDNEDQTSNNQRICLIVYATSATTVHGWGNECEFINDGFSVLVSGNTNYTVGEIGGTGNSMITVGAYTTRSSWIALNGTSYSIPGTVTGDIASFSSHGPTLDNRVKPDITAPGQWIISSLNRYDNDYTDPTGYWSTNSLAVGGHTEYYGVMRGTSMSSPAVAGILALWLQHNPNLSIAQAKQLLQSSAQTDSYTGTISASGNNTWGWGKIDALGGFTTPATTYTITANAADNTMGSVSGGGTYASGSSVTLTATANNGYTFDHWQDGNTQNPRIVTVTGNATYTAYFASASTNCTVTTFPYTMGFEPTDDIVCWTLTDSDGDQSNWMIFDSTNNAVHSGSQCATSESYSNTIGPLYPDNWLISPAIVIPSGMNLNLSWYAMGQDVNYATEHYTVYLSTSGAATSDFTQQLYSGNTTANWVQHTVSLANYAGQTVHIAFRHHDCTDMFRLNIDDILIASSASTPYTITVTSANSAMGSVSGGGTYTSGSSVTLTATANNGYTFDHWQDGNTQNPRTITVTGNATYTAYFVPVSTNCTVTTFPYTMGFEPTDDIVCWTLTDSDGDQSNWMILDSTNNAVHSGSQCATSESYSNTIGPLYPDNWLISPAIVIPSGMNLNLSWYAMGQDVNYATEHYTVYLSTSGTATSDFTQQLYSGNTTANWVQHTVSLANYAGQTVHIAFRHHDCTDMFRLNIDDILIASSASTPYTITVTSANSAMGSVSGGGTYTSGSSVTLTATANNGYTFDHWQDGNTQNPRTVTVTGNATYTAYFVPVSTNCTVTTFPYTMGFEPTDDIVCWTLTDSDGDQSNWMILDSTNNAVHSGSQCATSESYSNITGPLYPDNWLISPAIVIPSGMNLDLSWYAMGQDADYATEHYTVYLSTSGTATSDFTQQLYSGNTTANWVQHTVSLANYAGQTVHIAFRHHDCTDMFRLNIDDISITQNSTPITSYTITATSANSTMGSVSGGGTYTSGSNATLTATANNGYAFDHWQDGNTQNPRTVTVTGNATYTAYFEPVNYNITVLSSNNTMGSVYGSGSFPFGSTTTISATANNGYHFVQWQDGNTQSIRTITVTGNATYTAFFEATQGIEAMDEDNVTIVTKDRSIVIYGVSDNTMLKIYDIVGREVVSETCKEGHLYKVPATGVYMVQLGDTPARKVAVLR